MKTLVVLLALITSSCAAQAPFQSTSPTEFYGSVPAAQVYESLGTNINPSNEWEYQAAQAAHMTWGRFDCAWSIVEIQNLPQNTSAGFQLPRPCASGLAFSKTYGIHAIVDALYGPPYGKVATGVTAVAAPRGSTSIQLSLTSGLLANVVPAQSYIKIGQHDVSAHHAYAGTLITAVSGNSINLASALNTDIPAGSSVVLNLQLYPPVSIAPGTSYLANRSVRAYENYVHFLQTNVTASGFPGRVSLWNEPVWPGDPWDIAALLYDHSPPEQRLKPGFGVELAFAALNLPVVPGAQLDNGYTNKTGFGSVMATYPNQPNFINKPSQTFATESFHPYGRSPEDGAWNPACVQTHAAASMLRNVYKDCTPPGAFAGSNTKWQAAVSSGNNGAAPMTLGITETGYDRVADPTATETQIARYDLRQFLTYAGLGVRPIVFYRLSGDRHLEWMHPDHTPYPVYTAFHNLMADIATIAHSTVANGSNSANPVVTAYTGTYPLATVLLTGSRPGDRADSEIFYAWQRSYVTTGKWTDLSPPPPAALSIAIPPGMKVTAVKDTVTSSPIPFKANRGSLSFLVSDNPIEILLQPASHI